MKLNPFGINRRKLLKVAAAASAVQMSSPFVISALGEETVKIGLDDPLTGAYASLGKNELIGAQLAVEQINAKGGILGRRTELLVEDSTTGDVGTAVQKARKLIDRDKVSFLIGNVNSAIALALGQVAAEKNTLMIVPGGHTDAVTGKDCHWSVFRICNTTWMETNSIAKLLIEKYGKKWYFITPDYAFGHTLQQGFEAGLKKYGGTEVGADLSPLGTTDFSSYLIKAGSANPDVIIFLHAGDDMVNVIKQAVQFGFDKRFHLAGAQQELEVLTGLSPEARVGSWVFEWYWNQPKVPHVAEFVSEIRKKSGGKVPTARTWFGFASVWSCALAANHAKSLEAPAMAKALRGMKLPPEIALMPNEAYFREGDNQLMSTLFVGHAQSKGLTDPEDLFVVDDLVKGDAVALPVSQTGCSMKLPA